MGGKLREPPAVVCTGPGRLDIFALSEYGSMQHLAYGPSGWSEWRDLGGVLKSSPAAVSWGPGRYDVFALRAGDTYGHHWAEG